MIHLHTNNIITNNINTNIMTNNRLSLKTFQPLYSIHLLAKLLILTIIIIKIHLYLVNRLLYVQLWKHSNWRFISHSLTMTTTWERWVSGRTLSINHYYHIHPSISLLSSLYITIIFTILHYHHHHCYNNHLEHHHFRYLYYQCTGQSEGLS